MTTVLLALVLAVLVGFVVAAAPSTHPGLLGSDWTGGPLGLTRAAGLLFFAVAGYARIATMGEGCATRPRSSRAPCGPRWPPHW